MSLSLIICFKSCLCSFFHNFCVWIEVYLDDSKQIISKKKPILIRRSTLRPCNESFKNTVSWRFFIWLIPLSFHFWCFLL
jgi:hypothetical protein